MSQTGTACECAAAGVLVVDKMQIKLNFAVAEKDQITIKGKVPISPDFNPEGVTVLTNVGGVVRPWTLDAKGTSKTEFGKLQVKLKKSHGVVLPDAVLQVKVKGSFQSQLADEGLTSRDTKAEPVQIKDDVTVGGAAYTAVVTQEYTAKTGKTGKAK